MKKKLISIFLIFSNILVFSEENTVEVKEISVEEENTYQKRKEKNEKLFPLFAEQARARGINLPLPFGVSILGNVTNVHTIGEGLDVKFKEVGFDDIDLRIDGNITAQITGIMLDFYPLPMLNIFGYGAYIRTSGKLDFKLGNRDVAKNIDFGDDGKAGGLGFNLSGGYNNFFAGLNSSYSFSKMDRTGALKETFIITPRIGIKSKDNNFQTWLGWMFMNKDSGLTGTMPPGLIEGLSEFDYVVHVKTPSYAPTIGFRFVPVTHFEVVGEAFLANDFNGVNLRLAYRF